MIVVNTVNSSAYLPSPLTLSRVEQPLIANEAWHMCASAAALQGP